MKSKKFLHTFSSLKLTKRLKVELLIFVILVITYQMLSYFLVLVRGSSMEPAFQNNNLLYFSKKVDYISEKDIVVAHVNGETLIKRVIGVPGDLYYISRIDSDNAESYMMNTKLATLSDEWLASKKLTKLVIPKGYYFIEGENTNSTDSRAFGLVKKEWIFGKYLSKI